MRISTWSRDGNPGPSLVAEFLDLEHARKAFLLKVRIENIHNFDVFFQITLNATQNSSNVSTIDVFHMNTFVMVITIVETTVTR